MADHFYGVNVGHGLEPGGVAGAAGVLTGTSTTSAKVELRVEDGVSGLSGNKFILLQALDAIRAKIVESDAPA
jgi:hypothetical protein